MTKTTQQLVKGWDLKFGSDLGCEVVEAERKDSEMKTVWNSPAYCPPASTSLISKIEGSRVWSIHQRQRRK